MVLNPVRAKMVARPEDYQWSSYRATAGLERVHTVPGKHFPQEDQAPAIARRIAEFARVSEPAGE